MQSIYGRNYYLKIKIEKAGSATIATEFGWADGKTCLPRAAE